MQPLSALRRRLTAWYAATFGLILVLLGTGLYLGIRRQLAQQLSESLTDATRELISAAQVREDEAGAATGALMDAVDELHIPDRRLFLFDTFGRAVKPGSAPRWIAEQALVAARHGYVDVYESVARDTARNARTVLSRGKSDTGTAPMVDVGAGDFVLHAERFQLRSGRAMVAVVVADQVELANHYAALIAAFGGVGLAALMLVAAGGYFLAGKSMAPVERSMEYTRRFMAYAAHELRTPVTVLQTTAEVTLHQSRSTDEYVVALERVDREARRLGGIVNDLLTLARADAGERRIGQERVFLDDIALDAASAAKPLAQARDVTVTITAFEETVVIGDPALLHQIVVILLDNAVKYTSAGGTVELGVTTEDGLPTVTVRDTGIGIPASDISRVFERFYRGDPARPRSAGAGLGLSIAQWIAEVHGAGISIASEEGKGTTVTVQFSPLGPGGIMSS